MWCKKGYIDMQRAVWGMNEGIWGYLGGLGVYGMEMDLG